MSAEIIGRRQRQVLETKNRLMTCAAKLFREKGFYNVTVDEINEHANSSKGGFYTHFSSKEELLLKCTALIDNEYEKFFEERAETDDVIEELLQFITYIFNVMEEKIGLEFLSVIYSSQIKDTSFPNFSITQDRTYYQALETLINKGKENNEIKSDLPTPYIIKIITTAIRGSVYDWCLSKGEYVLSEYGKEIVAILLHGIRK